MKISGTIFDENMKFLGDANVEVLGENRNTSADGDGYFEIEVNGINSQLRFTHASKDFDTISVAEFQDHGDYIQLYPHTLDEVSIPRNTPTKSTNVLGWILGIATAIVIGRSLVKNQPKEVKV